MAKNYISVSGVGTEHERKVISDIFNETEETDSPINWFVGIQSSTKSQVLGIENSMGRKWHPVGDDIVPLLRPNPDEKGLNILHFACSEKNPEAVKLQISGILARMSMHEVQLQGMQLNGLSVGIEDYSHIFDQISHLPVRILQLSRKVIELADPNKISEYLADQPEMYVLLDTSGGTGEPYNPDIYKPWVESLSQVIPHNIAVAGGLKASNIREKLQPLLEINPILSVDAEGNLRSGGIKPPERWLNLAKVREYVTAAYNLLT